MVSITCFLFALLYSALHWDAIIGAEYGKNQRNNRKTRSTTTSNSNFEDNDIALAWLKWENDDMALVWSNWENIRK